MQGRPEEFPDFSTTDFIAAITQHIPEKSFQPVRAIAIIFVAVYVPLHFSQLDFR
jgi:hypothetical protein